VIINDLYSILTGRRSLSLILQTETAECYLACIAMIAGFYGHETNLSSLRRRFNPSMRGATMSRAIEIAESLGMNARPLRAELECLVDLDMPCILHWDLNHFVVLGGIKNKRAEIYDPARGKYYLTLEKVSSHFTGVILELNPNVNFSKRVEEKHVTLKSVVGGVSGLRRVATQIFGIALAIEVIALVIPFQIQWVLDQVLPTGDVNLLVAMTVGFLVIVGVQAGLYASRGWVLSWLGGSLIAQWTSNLFSHLLKLPTEYFEKRHIGDIASRLGSARSMQDTLTGSFIQAVLDGITGSLALFILCTYSVPLTCIILVTLTIYGLFRCAMYGVQKRINEEQLIFVARQQSEMMESIRGIQAIKLAGKQHIRSSRFTHVTLEAVKRNIRNQRVGLAFGALNLGLFASQRTLLIAIGAYLVTRESFSAGMMVAFLAYADQVTSKLGALIDRTMEFRMLRLYSERIADIALSAPEANVVGSYSGPEPAMCIEVVDLGFKYCESEPWIIRNLNLSFDAHESTAIVGPSGCGKTTFVKLLLGLLEPTEGAIKIGGVDIRNYGLGRYRKLIGAVMQDDDLFSGSIADNISFFDDESSMQVIMDAAKAAVIHNEIIAMPMGYESLINDMGSALSGGQKQRIILARAIYKKPGILILDEATSHLDVANERMVNTHIENMKITKISVAHRPETIAMADRIVDFGVINAMKLEC
jgi:ATP-binding cassette, subfamily B, bacterial CvaB/MchF/RaxB